MTALVIAMLGAAGLNGGLAQLFAFLRRRAYWRHDEEMKRLEMLHDIQIKQLYEFSQRSPLKRWLDRP